MTERTKIAFLGLGAMGARMASRLVGTSTTLKLWSRSGVPQQFEQLRPLLAPSAAAAVHGAEIVIGMLRDDEASRAVWLEAGALASVSRGSIVIECSTLTPAWVSTLAEQMRSAGCAFLDAPVVGSLPQAVSGELTFLTGGAAAAVAIAEPTLLRLGR